MITIPKQNKSKLNIIGLLYNINIKSIGPRHEWYHMTSDEVMPSQHFFSIRKLVSTKNYLNNSIDLIFYEHSLISSSKLHVLVIYKLSKVGKQ